MATYKVLQERTSIELYEIFVEADSPIEATELLKQNEDAGRRFYKCKVAESAIIIGKPRRTNLPPPGEGL